MIGPVLMGLSRPVHVLARGASVSDVVNLAAIAAIEAQEIARSREEAGAPATEDEPAIAIA
jgi:hypothetical protein